MKIFNWFLVILLAIGCYCGYDYSKKLKTENVRLQKNFYIVQEQIDSVIDRNGELHFTVNTLEVKKKELEKSNTELTSEIKNMRIKLKNVEQITSSNLSYQFIQDSLQQIISVYEQNSLVSNVDSIKVFQTNYNNDYISTHWKSIVDNKNNTLQITDYQCIFYDSLLYITEIEYKGWWFWRKPKNIKLHVKSVNPYSQINDVRNIQIIK